MECLNAEAKMASELLVDCLVFSANCRNIECDASTQEGALVLIRRVLFPSLNKMLIAASLLLKYHHKRQNQGDSIHRGNA